MAIELAQLRSGAGTLTDSGLRDALSAVTENAKGVDVAAVIEKDPRAFVGQVLRLTAEQKQGLQAFPAADLQKITSPIADALRTFDPDHIGLVIVRNGNSGPRTSALCKGGSATTTIDNNPPGGGGPRVTATVTINF